MGKSMKKLEQADANEIKQSWSRLLYIDLQPCQTCHSKDGRSAYSIGVGKLGWQYGTGIKSHGTVTDGCTGREWPVNCMTVISARWWSNMPFQRRRKWHIPMASYGEILSGWLNYYITWWRQEVRRFGDRRVWRQDVVEKVRLSNPGERERNTDGHKSGEVNMWQFCSVSNSLPDTTFQIKWEVYFSKRTVSLVFIVLLICLCIASAYENTTRWLEQR